MFLCKCIKKTVVFDSIHKLTNTLISMQSGGGASFTAPIQTGSEAHSASYTMGTGSFSGVKRPERGVDHPPTSSAGVKERV